MSEALYINPDVLLRNIGQSWIVSNPRLRTHVELDSEAAKVFIAMGTLPAKPVEGWIAEFNIGKGKDRTIRGLGRDGLHADHSGLSLESSDKWLSGIQLCDLLKERSLLVANQETATARLKPLSGLFDRESLGTFHQRVGQYLLLDKRVKAHWREWHDQKFSSDGKALLDNPYRAMQEPFFDNYFNKDRIKNFRVLDFGCGNAYYAAKFAERAGHVIGLDNSSELLEIAKKNHGDKKNLELILTRSFEEVLELMAKWGPGSFDLIYLQDTLLLLLQPEMEKPSELLPALFAGFRRLLRPGGSLCAMEPNPSFWLANRYGDSAKPYAIVTEYRNSVFNVAPTLDRLLPVMGKAGLALKDLQHPAPMKSNPNGKYGYQEEFPIWDFFVFVPV
jgi:SAM-dependent methyltransferase